MVVPGRALIEIELKLTTAEASDVDKNAGYSASAKRYGVPKRHCHRRLLATDGDEKVYPGGYVLVKWSNVAVQLRIVAARMVRQGEVLAASTALGFVGAIEQNLIGFSSSLAELALTGKPVPLSTALIEHLQAWLNWGDKDAKSKGRLW